MRAARLLSSGLSQKIRKSFFSACCAPKPAQKRCFLIVFTWRCCELFRAHAGGSTAGSGIVPAGPHRPMPFSGLPCTSSCIGRSASPPSEVNRHLHYITQLVQGARRDPGRAACDARRACTDSPGSAVTWAVCNTASPWSRAKPTGASRLPRSRAFSTACPQFRTDKDIIDADCATLLLDLPILYRYLLRTSATAAKFNHVLQFKPRTALPQVLPGRDFHQHLLSLAWASASLRVTNSGEQAIALADGPAQPLLA
jgi:hypothetical protein